MTGLATTGRPVAAVAAMRAAGAQVVASLRETTAGLRPPHPERSRVGAPPVFSTEIYDGSLGVALGLAAAAGPAERPGWRPVAARLLEDAAAALSLASLRHGLHAGDGGFVVAALRLAPLTPAVPMVDWAETVALRLAEQVPEDADVLGGAAGTGLALLALRRVRRSAAVERGLLRLVEWLGTRALPTPAGPCWPWRHDGEGLDSHQTGFAHGSAGIVAFLARCVAEGVRRRGVASLLREAGHFLDAHAERQGALTCWPVSRGRPATRHHWCHGTTGLARAYLARHAAGEGPALGIALAAGDHAWHRTPRDERVCHCHGAVGLLELSLDLAAIDPHGPWRRRADLLARRQSAWLRRADGRAIRGDPGYSTGVSGLVHVLARWLGEPGAAPLDVPVAIVVPREVRVPRKRPPLGVRLPRRWLDACAPRPAVPLVGPKPHLVPVDEPTPPAALREVARALHGDVGAGFVALLARAEEAFRALGRRHRGLVAEAALSLEAHAELVRAWYACLVLAAPPHVAPDDRRRVARRVLDGHLAALREMLDRVGADVRRGVLCGVRLPLTGVQPVATEPHRGQRRVFILTDSAGRRFLYKPRDVRLDWWLAGATRYAGVASAARRLDDWLTRRGARTRIPMHAIDPVAGTHGYVEWLAAGRHRLPAPSGRRAAPGFERHRLSPCRGWRLRSDAEARAFWRDAGGLAALAAAFGVTDLHRENLLVARAEGAQGPRLHAIDLEVALVGFGSVGGTQLVTPAATPPSTMADHGHSGFDTRLPAFCSYGAPDWASVPGRRPVARLAWGEVSAGTPLNAVLGPRGETGPGPWFGALVEGFVDGWLGVRALRRSLASAAVRLLKGAEVRALVQHTAHYVPAWERRLGGAHRGLDAIADGARAAAPFADSELAQLDALDVPRYVRRVGGRGLWWHDGRTGRAVAATDVRPHHRPASPAACLRTAATVQSLVLGLVDLVAFAEALGPLPAADREAGLRRTGTVRERDLRLTLARGPQRLVVSVEAGGDIRYSGTIAGRGVT